MLKHFFSPFSCKTSVSAPKSRFLPSHLSPMYISDHISFDFLWAIFLNILEAPLIYVKVIIINYM